MKRHLLIAIAVVGVASLFAVGSASAGAGECSGTNGYTYNLCFWQNGDYTGTIYAYAQGTGSHQCQSDTWCFVGSNANDQASSVYNYRQHTSWVGLDWVNNGPGSQTACLTIQYANPHLGNEFWPGPSYTGSANDSISSFDLTYNGTTCPGGTQFYP